MGGSRQGGGAAAPRGGAALPHHPHAPRGECALHQEAADEASGNLISPLLFSFSLFLVKSHTPAFFPFLFVARVGSRRLPYFRRSRVLRSKNRECALGALPGQLPDFNESDTPA